MVSLGDLRAPTMLCRPLGANHNNTPYTTGVDTPAYTLTPFGLIISLRISLPFGEGQGWGSSTGLLH